MITAVRYIPLLIASTVMMGSLLFKVLFLALDPISLIRDVVVFFILYHVIERLTVNIEKILKNYWKML